MKKLSHLVQYYGFKICFFIIFCGSISSCISRVENTKDTIPLKPTGNFNEWFLRTNDKKASLYIKEIGKGEPVIVLHGGFGNDHTGVIEIAEGLEDKFHFIFYDQRGSSLSYCDTDAISVENHVKDLEQIRETMELENFTLVSHSAGTVLAFLYLKQYPERLKNVVLLGAMEHKNGDESFFTEAEKANWEIQKKQFDAFKSKPEIQNELDKLGFSEEPKSAKDSYLYNHIKYYAASNIYDISKWRDLNVAHWNPIAAQAASKSYDWVYNHAEMLLNHPRPISVINGKYDYVVGAKGSPTWKNLVNSQESNLELIIIDEASHLPWIDKPMLFKEAFENALLRH